ncbi:MAG: hypothetical protein MJZ18_03720 [Bacteroidales bacterium]|nr:hypothetical protein [Bacteroidales bacterium]
MKRLYAKPYFEPVVLDMGVIRISMSEESSDNVSPTRPGDQIPIMQSENEAIFEQSISPSGPFDK